MAPDILLVQALLNACDMFNMWLPPLMLQTPSDRGMTTSISLFHVNTRPRCALHLNVQCCPHTLMVLM